MSNKFKFTDVKKPNKGDKVVVSSKQGDEYYRVIEIEELPNGEWEIEIEKIGITK